MTSVATTVSAQSAVPELTTAFRTVSEFLVRSAEMVPESKYAERPVPGVRSFLELIAHVADGNAYYCRLASGQTVPWSDAIEKTVKTRNEAIAALKSSIASCEAEYQRQGAPTSPLIENIAHANLHYGNVIVYLRGLGMTPPSS